MRNNREDDLNNNKASPGLNFNKIKGAGNEFSNKFKKLAIATKLKLDHVKEKLEDQTSKLSMTNHTNHHINNSSDLLDLEHENIIHDLDSDPQTPLKNTIDKLKIVGKDITTKLSNITKKSPVISNKERDNDEWDDNSHSNTYNESNSFDTSTSRY